MLNLSDKELDRLAREAANEHDPGNLSGPGSWDRLRLRLDNELGRASPNLLRSIRRMPFYYAPAILLLVGVSYYILKQGRANTRPPAPSSASTAGTASAGSPSGSPPVAMNSPGSSGTTGAAPSTKNKINTYQSTSTPTTTAADASGKDRLKAGTDQSATAPVGVPANGDGSATAGNNHYHAQQHPAGSGNGQTDATNTANEGNAGNSANDAGTKNSGGAANGVNAPGTANSGHATNSVNDAGTQHDGRASNGVNSAGTEGVIHSPSNDDQPDQATANNSHGEAANSSKVADLQRSGIDPPEFAALPKPVVDDSGLRLLATKTVAKSADPINLGKKKSPSLNINKRLQLGFSVAPDFTSVDALAGDKPGSSIGITADYEFFSKWHLHTGVLLSRKNYTAAQQDYHVPYDYYRMNNLHDVYFIKGTLNLIEIPLALRYDFSVAGNTVFFVSGGVSSYLLTHENCNYYFDLFGREACQGFNYNAHHASLFGTVDLSTGVETGISNTLSLMVAPYMKIPTSGMGFGNIEMSSIGVDFSLKYTPVLSRKRH